MEDSTAVAVKTTAGDILGSVTQIHHKHALEIWIPMSHEELRRKTVFTH